MTSPADEELVAACRMWADWHKAEAEHLNSKHPDDDYALLSMSTYQDQERLLRALADRLEARGGVEVAKPWHDPNCSSECERGHVYSGPVCPDCGFPEDASLSRREPEGFKLVPVEPTEAMCAAIEDAMMCDFGPDAAVAYAAMLAAAPAPQFHEPEGWRDIESAPRDDTAVFGDEADHWIKRGLVGKQQPWGWSAWVGQMDAGTWLGVAEDGTCWECEVPTHYQPLPAPPSPETE